MCICDILLHSHMFTLNSHWNCIFIQFRMVSFYTSIMDTIPIETLSLLDCDVLLFFYMQDFPVPKPKS